MGYAQKTSVRRRDLIEVAIEEQRDFVVVHLGFRRGGKPFHSGAQQCGAGQTAAGRGAEGWTTPVVFTLGASLPGTASQVYPQ